jgi:hypothetical protein
MVAHSTLGRQHTSLHHRCVLTGEFSELFGASRSFQGRASSDGFSEKHLVVVTQVEKGAICALRIAGNRMSIDTLLGLFGSVTGLIGLFLAYFFYKKSVRTKILAIAYTDPIPLMMTLGNLEVVYGGFSITALSRAYILFWNRGTAPIEQSDFLSPIKVNASAPILNLHIHDKDPAASVTLDEHTRDLSIILLRPGEAITLVVEVVSEGYRPDVSIEMKSTDMSTFTSGFQHLYPGIFGFLTVMVLLVGEIIILNAWIDVFSTTAPFFPFKQDPGVFLFLITSLALIVATITLLAIIPLIVGMIVRLATKSVLARMMTPVAWKFSEFKVSAWAIRARLKKFRKFIDAEYKKIAPS